MKHLALSIIFFLVSCEPLPVVQAKAETLVIPPPPSTNIFTFVWQTNYTQVLKRDTKDNIIDSFEAFNRWVIEYKIISSNTQIISVLNNGSDYPVPYVYRYDGTTLLSIKIEIEGSTDYDYRNCNSDGGKAYGRELLAQAYLKMGLYNKFQTIQDRSKCAPGYELLTDGQLYRIKVIATDEIDSENYLSKKDAITTTWILYDKNLGILNSDFVLKRTWKKVD